MVSAVSTSMVSSASRKRADRIARSVVFVVAVPALVLALLPVVLHLGSLDDDLFGNRTSVSTVTRVTSADGHTATTTTKTASPEKVTTSERVLGAGGIVLLRLVGALFVVFAAGALAQRALLGRFELRAGPVEIPDIEEASVEVTELVAAQVASLQERVVDQQRQLADVFRQQAHTAHAVAQVVRQLPRGRRVRRGRAAYTSDDDG
jgi:hypothetical protein